MLVSISNISVAFYSDISKRRALKNLKFMQTNDHKLATSVNSLTQEVFHSHPEVPKHYEGMES
jgi:hypothetical protein